MARHRQIVRRWGRIIAVCVALSFAATSCADDGDSNAEAPAADDPGADQTPTPAAQPADTGTTSSDQPDNGCDAAPVDGEEPEGVPAPFGGPTAGFIVLDAVPELVPFEEAIEGRDYGLGLHGPAVRTDSEAIARTALGSLLAPVELVILPEGLVVDPAGLLAEWLPGTRLVFEYKSPPTDSEPAWDPTVGVVSVGFVVAPDGQIQSTDRCELGIWMMRIVAAANDDLATSYDISGFVVDLADGGAALDWALLGYDG